MSDGQNFILAPANARDRMKAAWDVCCSILQLGKSVRVYVEEIHPTRSLEQNAKFHAICGDIAKSGHKWAGKVRDTEDWKRLLVDAWARESNREQVEMVPSLDGSGLVNLGIQTRRMKVMQMAELIEFAQHYCVDNNINTWDTPRQES